MSHSNIPALYQEPTFGNLVTLPTVHEQNASLLKRAKDACDPVVKDLPTDVTTLSIDELDALDTKLNGLQAKLSDGEKISLERRKPFTQYMDKIKTEFTGIEAGFKTMFTAFKSTRDAIAKERMRRQQEENMKQQKEIAKKQEGVMFKSHIFQAYNANFLNVLNAVTTKMIDTFNSKKADDLKAYTDTLSKWEPKFTTQAKEVYVSSKFPVQYIDETEVLNLTDEVINELKPQHVSKFVADLTKERDRLIELTDSRIKELNESDAAAIKAREQKEAADRQTELDRQKEAQAQQASVQQENDLLNATFDVAATANDPISLTKNTTVKKKYEANSHAAWAAIIQHWVHADMSTMTIDELAKKLGFMLTSANKKLNEGVTIEAKGLTVTEDVSTRTSKTK